MSIPPAILRFLTESLGMEADAAGKGAVGRALTASMRQEGIPDAQAYEKLFLSSPEVRQRFIDAVVVGETWFFRDRGPFACLARHARTLRDARADDVLNILSAPCSTGEEPYSIVMTLLDAGLPPSAFRVDGVDVSARALEKARLACYGNGAFRGNLGRDTSRFFETTPSGRRVIHPVARQVTFHLDNLVLKESLAGRGPYAIIFCRNLLIYLIPEARLRVFKRLDGLLMPGGLLFTGHTETTFWNQQGYLPIAWDRAFALTKPASLPLPATVKTAIPRKPYAPPADERREIKSPADPTLAYQDALSGAKPSAAHSPMAEAFDPHKQAKPVSKDTADQPLQEARRLADGGDMDGALHLCHDYTRRVGPVAEAYCLMGIIHMSKHDMNRAEDYFLKALYLDPGHYESLVHISLIYGQKGNERKAALYRERAKRGADILGKTLEKKQNGSLLKADDITGIRTNG